MRIALLTIITLIAFAANSVLGRVALQDGAIDPAGYTLIRLASGAIMLSIIVAIQFGPRFQNLTSGHWFSALMLFGYAAAFSFSYVNIDTGIGALILFACVQATMIGWAIFRGDRPQPLEWLGIIIAFSAFIWLVSPGLSAPDPWAAFLMALSGVCWGVYSLRGKGFGNPTKATAGNFILSVPMAIILCNIVYTQIDISFYGAALAVTSGAITSGMGYALWYRLVGHLTTTSAAILQLVVPVLAGFGGTIALSEPWTLRFIVASILILGGVAVAILAKSKRS